MGELGNLWSYQEDADLKMKLQSTRLELEAMRHEINIASEQTREKEKKLHDLLQMVYKERDDAREQLLNLLNKINPVQPHLMMMPSNNVPSDDSNQLHQKQHPRANSSITESNTLSDPYNNLNNNHSYVSSPVDSIFDAVTSPEFSTFNMCGDSGNNSVAFLQEMCQSQSQTHSLFSGHNPRLTNNIELDHASVVIDGLVKGKVLPQKGKLLEAVMEAGPLLQTLMLAGPLPRWRNPPPLQTFKIPQMAAITGTDYHPIVVAAPVRSSWTPFTEMSCGSSSHMDTNNIPMLNFGNGGGVNNGRLLMNMNNQIAAVKRQRLM